ncbi:MAG: flotillin family protein [Planctomycetes bacterium]|nr:flotillin family protein [Planctomycetota bacterium]
MIAAAGWITALVAAVFALLGLRHVPNNMVGIVEKRFAAKGSLAEGFIALNGEAGYQPELLRGGLHWRMPLQYKVHKQPLVTIPQGHVGYIFARDGRPLDPTQSLGSNIEAGDFETVRDFLAKGGQRGPQRKVLREGTYAINLAQFVVITDSKLYYLPLEREDAKVFGEMADVIEDRDGFTPIVIKGADDIVGVVTVHDGPGLTAGQIIAPSVGSEGDDGHNSFQDPEKFLAAGGLRGRQFQVLVDGTYYINRLFATVEFIPKTVVEVGHVGVVVSYTGEHGADLSGTEYRHGELVKPGERGVWSDPLLPGKYAFNTYAGKVIMVPTTNFLLKWISGDIGDHRFDEHLAEVSLITKDAFEPTLPLSVVVHIDYRKAPLVIQRFGDVQKLVEQTLDPMVSAYFKNVAQTRTLIQLLQDRSAIQQQASQEMRAKFAYYNLQLEEVLIGTPKSVKGDTKLEQILDQLRIRQVAEERIQTYAQQEKAAVQERELRQAESIAAQQARLTESEIAVAVETNKGKAEYQRSLQEASRIKAMAAAEASKIRFLAEADAERAARVGIAQAMAVEEQVRAYGGPVYQLTQSVMNRFAEAIEESRVDVVPKVIVGGNGSGGQQGGNIMEALLTMMLSDKMLGNAAAVQPGPQDPKIAAVREKLVKSLADAAT